ncbi:MAG: hypothetical protein IJC85_03810 [Oscillospiraceae bacterium]|nr:hypothetical protein [Oscillospiraceae bacterium]
MSFFNKLFGALNKLEEMKDALEDVAESLQKTASEQTTSAPQTASPASAPVSAPVCTPVVTPAETKTYDTGDHYFASLITGLNFPGYMISTDVHANTLDSGAHPSCYPISYLFSKGSQPVLAVFVMNTNQYRSMTARGTYQVLEDHGIPSIRFFKGMENNREYVLNRIRENLN